MNLYTDADVAQMFQLSESAIVTLRKSLGWPHVKMGRSIRYTEAQIHQIVELHSHVQTAEGLRFSRGLAGGLTPQSATYWARESS